jgi:hypothetical protein
VTSRIKNLPLRVAEKIEKVAKSGAWQGLASCPAAVYEDGLAGDERRRARSQENNRTRDVHGFADAMQGSDALQYIGARLRIG